MDKMRIRLAVAGVLVLSILACLGIVRFRQTLTYFMPIEHTGTILRIADFHKGGFNSGNEGTRQLRQFAIIFEDGFDCEGTDTSLAALREGDQVTIRGYRDMRGWPIVDPEWLECDEAQLIKLFTEPKE